MNHDKDEHRNPVEFKALIGRSMLAVAFVSADVVVAGSSDSDAALSVMAQSPRSSVLVHHRTLP